MSTNQAIFTLKNQISSLKEQVSAAMSLVEMDGDDETAIAKLEGLTAETEKAMEQLKVLEKAEATIKSRAVPIGDAPSFIRHRGTNSKGAFENFVKIATAEVLGGIHRMPLSMSLEHFFPDDNEVKAVASITTKAAAPLGTTTDPNYARELTNQGVGEFWDLLKPSSMVAKLPFKPLNFMGNPTIKIPMRTDTGAVSALNNFHAHWVAEGSPIRVGSAVVGSTILSRYFLGIIGVWSRQLSEMSVPAISELIRNWMLQDTSQYLDATFFSNAPAVPNLMPAGILNGIGAANTHTSLGNTPANMQADFRVMLSTMAGNMLGERPFWLMSSDIFFGLSTVLSAQGTLQFPSVQNGTLHGVPILHSPTFPAKTILLIDTAQIYMATDAPSFAVSTEAALHMDNDPATVAPLSNGGAVADPIRSLWQTDSIGLRMVAGISFSAMRSGAVQLLDTVNY